MAKLTDITNDQIGQVFAHKLNYLASQLAKYGVSPSVLVKDTSVAVENLNDPNYKVDREQIVGFYRNVLQLQIPGLGLLLGKSIRTNDYGLYGCTLLSCHNLQAALEFSVRYHGIATKTVKMSLTYDEHKPCAYYRFEDLLIDPQIEAFNIKLQCAIVQALTRECLGDKSFIFDELRFSFDKPKNHLLYAEHFKCPISYNQAHNEFVVSQQKLDLSTSRNNPFAMPLLLDQCEMVLDSIANKDEFLVTINQWIAANMHKEHSAEELSGYLCMSPRTLRRKLSERGTSFRDLVNELRAEAAKKLLIKTRLTMEDIAVSIGFNDPSNFRAAFKKWTGYTPSSYRENHRA